MIKKIENMLFFDMDIRVQYHETDQMGIVHHSNYLKYFELVRTEMFREIGVTYREIEKMGILMPVHSLEVKYIKPIFYDQQINAKVNFLVSDVKYKIKFNYELYSDNIDLCSTGTINIVFLDKLKNKITLAPEILINAIKEK